ncbi:MAG: hypothetical protein UV63_C0003G0017 [Microgenomates group bacterium GW2011_GWC1_43_11]|uniref:Glycosyltransferase RgtA/B/C/D-like domain-containing protein n=2 Tax=Candidatus Gottesmaniibacteriota TaxID=1752720 RepID=A0A0G1IQH0_9BACT|nr:MAG: hypothetical protein UV63_C0003G0017 [Microgenomates group bacterium GW2011_GWC1_43_11]KKT38980.1 MAG: hypothetical protein UW22_C0003G0022 [Candidatus Gottesmanbacteria bacterium GW2011_GWB1_44_11c]KKT61405.1 MAG: hypothetical protein UW52_C0004G0017 [Candidatus Gottesmanbacteria bacterium GW2011_GWA1_44_24b]
MPLKYFSAKRIFFLILGVLLAVFVFAIPPFQKPDEPLHFKRAFALSMGQITCKHSREYSRGYFTYPKSVDAFPDAMLSQAIIMKPEGKYPLSLFFRSYPIDLMRAVDLPYNCTLPFTGYIPLSLGILFTLPINNLLISFYGARLTAALVFFLSILFCFRILPKRYWYILGFSSVLPMVLQQVTAVSYDSLAISLGCILFSLFMRFLEKKALRLRELILFYIILLVFLFTKPGYYLFSLVSLILLNRVYTSWIKKWILAGIMIIGIVAISWYSLTLPI